MATATKVFAFATMCIGMFIALLDIQIVSASLRDIGGGLSAGTDETAWVQTSYLIAEIIVIPLSGWLSRVFRRAGCSARRRWASPWPVCFAASPGTSRA
jgi:DHA2 family multidrug resistance protein